MKKYILLLSLYIVPLFAFSQFDMLVWSDEFDYNGLPDSTKWSYDVGGHGWGNEELQYYTDKRLENARVENGKLIIEARKENYEGNDYTSARLVTRNNGDWTYGRIEIRARLPQGKGTWPALWMLPTKWIYGSGDWPDVGEIDIMEHVGHKEGEIHGTIHTHDFNHMDGTQKSGQTFVGDAVSAFHVYAIEWTKEEIRWYVDGSKFFTYENNGDGWSAWPFDHPFHLIMNIAVGGTWGGAEGVDDTIFPQKLEVDYVRVYQTKNQLGNSINGAKELVPNAAGVKYSSKILNGSDYKWTVPDNAELLTQDTIKDILLNWGCDTGKIVLSTTLDNNTYTDTLPVKEKDVSIRGDLFWKSNDDPLLFFLDSMHSTSFQWTLPAEASIISGQGTDSVFVDWGESTGKVKVLVENNCLNKEYEKTILNPEKQYPYPDPFSSHNIPGEIEAVNYDYGGEGIAYHDNESDNQGSGPRQDDGVDTEYAEPGGNIGWFEQDEWLEYSIQIEDTLWIQAEFRVASDGGGGPLRITMNGEEKISNHLIPDTDGWGNFITHDVGFFRVTPEDTVMRVEANGGGFNLGKMTFTEGASTNLQGLVSDIDVQIYPNPVSSKLTIQSNKNIQEIEVFNVHGVKINQINLSPNSNSSIINTSDFPVGIYIIKIRILDNHIINKQIIKK
jgi:beta-glucanase (GH16 family)